MFEQCLYFNATALARLLEREWAQAFAEFDLTPPQAFLLRLVLGRHGQLQRELADALGISRPTATRLLDALQSKRYVERRSSPADRRESEVHPTSAALAIGSGLNQASARVTRRLKQVLGPETFADTVAKLRAVRSTLKE